MFRMIFNRPVRLLLATLATALFALSATPCTAQNNKDKIVVEAGAPLPFTEFGKGYTAPAGQSIAPRYRLRIGFVRLPKRAPDVRGISFVDNPPEIFRKDFQWIDIKTTLYRKGQAGNGKQVTKGPNGEDLPRTHQEGIWGYFLPKEVRGNEVLTTLYFHHSKVLEWEYFLGLNRGAKLQQSTIHTELEIPLNRWVIFPESSIPDAVRIPGSYLYFLFHLTEDK